MSVPDPVEVAEMVVLDEQIRSALASLPADLDVVIENAGVHAGKRVGGELVLTFTKPVAS